VHFTLKKLIRVEKTAEEENERVCVCFSASRASSLLFNQRVSERVCLCTPVLCVII